MALYRDPVDVLLGTIGRENNITLDRTDYNFHSPQPASPPDGSTASYNTSIKIASNTPAAPYVGEVEIFYNRLDLADLGRMVSLYVHYDLQADQDLLVYSPADDDTHVIIPSLNRRYGLNLTPADIILRPTVEVNGYKVAVMEATPESIGWVGLIEIAVMIGDLELEEHLVNTSLGGLPYPTTNLAVPFAQFYSYWRDFSAHYAYLSTVSVDDPITLELASVLSDVTGDAWLASGVGQYSLGDAQIMYSGTTEQNGKTNVDDERVIIIRLAVNVCTGLTGDLVLHFSEPLEPVI